MKKFIEPAGLNHVAEFHTVFDLPILESPQIPDSNRTKLRIALLQEELDELKAAILSNDLVEAADAFCDLQYVLSGAILEFGLAHKFQDLFDEVQRSNMSKACNSHAEALATQAYYLKEKNTESIIIEKQEKYLVYRKEDKKVLKSIAYSAANLAEKLV